MDLKLELGDQIACQDGCRRMVEEQMYHNVPLKSKSGTKERNPKKERGLTHMYFFENYFVHLGTWGYFR